MFKHSVASGDPTTSSVILWTKLSPINNPNSLPVQWEIATDTLFSQNKQVGIDSSFKTDNYTFKVDVKSLKPDTWYYFKFTCNGKLSPIGRTKTSRTNNINQTRLAIVSCSNYEQGYFNVYDAITKANDVEAFVHLGDYIYEYETGRKGIDVPGRTVEPKGEVITLDDYRKRYETYRNDIDLQRIHQNFPCIAIWDDHEIANNSYKDGAQNHSDDEGKYTTRLEVAKKAYYEWMPIRKGYKYKLYRKFSIGSNTNLLFLDTRIDGRDKQLEKVKLNKIDTTMTLLGKEQYNWLTTNLLSNKDEWNIIAQQVLVAPLRAGRKVVTSDKWDGYIYEREKLYNFILNNNIKNIVFLTGDIHSSWCNDLPLKKYKAHSGKNSLGVEFVTPGITSKNPKKIPVWLIKMFNKHVKYINRKDNGYYTLTITSDLIQADYTHINTTLTKQYETKQGGHYFVKKGESHLEKADSSFEFTNTNPPLVGY